MCFGREISKRNIVVTYYKEEILSIVDLQNITPCYFYLLLLVSLKLFQAIDIHMVAFDFGLSLIVLASIVFLALKLTQFLVIKYTDVTLLSSRFHPLSINCFFTAISCRNLKKLVWVHSYIISK